MKLDLDSNGVFSRLNVRSTSESPKVLNEYVGNVWLLGKAIDQCNVGKIFQIIFDISLIDERLFVNYRWDELDAWCAHLDAMDVIFLIKGYTYLEATYSSFNRGSAGPVRYYFQKLLEKLSYNGCNKTSIDELTVWVRFVSCNPFSPFGGSGEISKYLLEEDGARRISLHERTDELLKKHCLSYRRLDS